jgi:hypothetical protein
MILFVLSLLFYYGCSSSSSSSRYGTGSGETGSDDSNSRFSSENDDTLSTIDIDFEDSGDLPNDDGVDINSVMEMYDLEGDVSEYGTFKEKMLMGIIKYLDTPYKYGGSSKSGIDCSAFTQTIYKSTLSTNLLRSARDQYTQGEIVSDEDDLQFGDLVFFDTRSGVSPGHVGIYIGDELFAHASTKKGVTISSINHSYYQDRFMGGRRIKPEGTF